MAKPTTFTEYFAGLPEDRKTAMEQGVTRFVLDSTRTSVGFYEKCGYAKQGEEKAVRTRGVEILLVPMHKST